MARPQDLQTATASTSPWKKQRMGGCSRGRLAPEIFLHVGSGAAQLQPLLEKSSLLKPPDAARDVGLVSSELFFVDRQMFGDKDNETAIGRGRGHAELAFVQFEGGLHDVAAIRDRLFRLILDRES